GGAYGSFLKNPAICGEAVPEIYLDYNASAPTRPEVIEAVSQALSPRYGNASSIHQPGHRAKVLLESARESVAALLGAASPSEVLFTSGGTEANNLGIFGVARRRRGGHVIVSRIEHSSVLEAARGLEEEGFR